jgi:hypothetical protein
MAAQGTPRDTVGRRSADTALTPGARDTLRRLFQRSRQYPPEVSVGFIVEAASVDRAELDELLDELEPLLRETR